jgi:M6 family metalloprotease-like protein
MERGVRVALVLCFILIVSISVVSAGVFSDFWERITGKPIATCGDGVCETALFETSATCPEDCGGMPEAVCGNGIAESGEQCDDGNVINNDSCTNNCTIASCTDSDGGSNYDIKGTASNSLGTTRTDTCYTSISGVLESCSGGMCRLEEFICGNNNQVYVTMYTCLYGCSDGACVSEQETPECTDSDGGSNYNVRGYTTGELYDINLESGTGEVLTYTDSCNSSFYTNGLLEYQCGSSTVPSNYIVKGMYDCPNGCVNGACISEQPESVCGNNIIETGESCDDGNIQNDDGCSSVCTIEIPNTDFCTDSDSGANLYERGTCFSANATNYTDYCLNISGEDYIHEYSCVNNGGCDFGKRYLCSNGCVSGACVDEEEPESMCGNEVLEAGEECDDGNIQNNDGCSDTCQIEEPEPSCTDSDGGTDYYEKGETEELSKIVFTDYCVSEVGTSLMEFYCGENEEITFEYSDCDKGCLDGRCIEGEGILQRFLNVVVDLFTAEEQVSLSLVHPRRGIMITNTLQEIEGELTIYITDDFEDNQSNTTYILRESDDSERMLIFQEEQPDFFTGDKIRVRGIETEEGEFLLKSSFEWSEDESGIQLMSSSFRSPVDQRRIAVILFGFMDFNSVPYSVEDLEEFMFGDRESVRNYLLEVSYGKLDLKGDVFGPYTIPRDIDDCGHVSIPLLYTANYKKWGDEADKIVEGQGVDLDDYDHIMYIFPNPRLMQKNCSWGGIGNIGGKRTWIVNLASWSPTTFPHELGHNFGLHHARFLNCSSLHKERRNPCSRVEYGDPFNLMGAGSWVLEGHFNAANKLRLGWLPSDRVKIVSSEGFYTLGSIEAINPEFQYNALIVDDYILEYRGSKGFDAKFSYYEREGTIITKAHGRKTDLFDTKPDSLSYDQIDSPLLDGESFYDLDNEITITQLSHNRDSSEILVEYGPIDCTQKPPALGIFSFGSPDLQRGYTLFLANNDPPNCIGSREFNLEFVLPSDLSYLMLPSETSFVLAPREVANTSLILTSTSSEPKISEFSVNVKENNRVVQQSTFHYVFDLSLEINNTPTFLSGHQLDAEGEEAVFDLNWNSSYDPYFCRALFSTSSCGNCFDFEWSGPKDSSGFQRIGPLSAGRESRFHFYSIECFYDNGEWIRDYVTIHFDPLPKIPDITIIAEILPKDATSRGEVFEISSRTMIDDGDKVTLRWETPHDPECIASGGWSGSKSAVDSEYIGALSGPDSYTYTLTCTTAEGTDTETFIIDVRESQAPPEGTGETPSR